MKLEIELTVEDINILLDAMDSWLNREKLGETVGEMFIALAAGSRERAEEIISKAPHNQPQYADKKRQEAERVIILKAKLLKIKDQIGIEGLTND